MAVREILIYPQHKTELRRKSALVMRFSRDVNQLIIDLKETLLAHTEGIGLAAPQIDSHLRVVVVRLGSTSGEHNQIEPPVTLINPKIIEASNERKDFDGCLSFPGMFGETSRPHYLRVKGLDEKGKSFDRVYEGFNAVVVHHEIDHLDGVLFVDRIESLDDLYTVQEDERGELVRVPFKVDQMSP